MFKSLTVKARIWGGFLLILAFLLLVAVLGWFGLRSIDGNVWQFERVNANTVRVLTIDRNVAGLRRNVLVFTGSNGDTKALDRVRQLQGDLAKDLGEAINAASNPERKADLEQMRHLFEQYSANFEKVIQLRTTRDAALTQRLNPTGAAMREQLTSLLDATMAIKDYENAAIIGKAQEQLMLGRVNALRFLALPSDKLATEASEQFVHAEAAVKDQLAHEKDAGRRKTTEQVLQMLPTYVTAFGEIVTASQAMNRLISVENAKIAGDIGDLAAKVKASQLADLNRLGTDTKDTVSSQQTSSGGLSVLAVVLGLAFAALIARSILGPIAAMVAAMRELAAGRLDTVVPALERSDEIGEMAQAVQVFKQNAIDKQRMEAEQKAAEEAQRKAEEEQRQREAAIVAEVAEVAKAASEGEMDRQIDLAGKSGFL